MAFFEWPLPSIGPTSTKTWSLQFWAPLIGGTFLGRSSPGCLLLAPHPLTLPLPRQRSSWPSAPCHMAGFRAPMAVPWSYFSFFLDLLVPTLTANFNLFWEGGTLPPKFLLGDIILLHKKGEVTLLHNKWPITLLNAKYKIFAKIWQLCSTPVAQSLISWNQSMFIPSCSIHHSVLLCSENFHLGWSTYPFGFCSSGLPKSVRQREMGFLAQPFCSYGFFFEVPASASGPYSGIAITSFNQRLQRLAFSHYTIGLAGVPSQSPALQFCHQRSLMLHCH